MSRKAAIAIAVILALIAAGRMINRGVHPALAAKGNVDRAVLPAESERAPVAPEPVATVVQPSKAEPQPKPSPAAPKPASTPDAVAGVTDVDPHKAFGSKSAPVVMEVFSDFQCPACKTLYLTTNRQLMDNYVSTGKVYLIHRDFPLPMHAHSRVAARYARAAAQIGKVEPVEQVLFENQEKWEQSGDVDGTVASVLSAGDMAKVRALVKGGTLDPLIDKDYSLGQVVRVSQTPTTVFHANGQTFPFAGIMTYDTLKTFLNQLLGK